MCLWFTHWLMVFTLTDRLHVVLGRGQTISHASAPAEWYRMYSLVKRAWQLSTLSHSPDEPSLSVLTLERILPLRLVLQYWPLGIATTLPSLRHTYSLIDIAVSSPIDIAAYGAIVGTLMTPSDSLEPLTWLASLLQTSRFTPGYSRRFDRSHSFIINGFRCAFKPPTMILGSVTLCDCVISISHFPAFCCLSPSTKCGYWTQVAHQTSGSKVQITSVTVYTHLLCQCNCTFTG